MRYALCISALCGSIVLISAIVVRTARSKAALVHREQAAFTGQQRFMFIHIPKTAGHSVRERIHYRCQDEIAQEGGIAHTVVESRALAAGKRPIVVLREPIERLHSSFWFYVAGSNATYMRKGRGPQSQALVSDRSSRTLDANQTFLNFLDGLVNSTSPWRAYSLSIARAPQRMSGWTWSAHFDPQAKWLDADSPNTTVVCYDKRELGDRLRCALRAHVACDFSALNRQNVGRHAAGDAHGPSVHSLPPALRQLVLAAFKADYRLYHEHCGGAGGAARRAPPLCAGAGASSRTRRSRARRRRS